MKKLIRIILFTILFFTLFFVTIPFKLLSMLYYWESLKYYENENDNDYWLTLFYLTQNITHFND